MMEVVAGAAVVVSRVIVGAVLAVVVTTSRHMPYKLHAPAGFCSISNRVYLIECDENGTDIIGQASVSCLPT